MSGLVRRVAVQLARLRSAVERRVRFGWRRWTVGRRPPVLAPPARFPGFAGALRVEAVRTLARSTTALHISTRLVLPAPAPAPRPPPRSLIIMAVTSPAPQR